VLDILEGLTSPEAGFANSIALVKKAQRLAASGQVAEAEGGLEKSLDRTSFRFRSLSF
jgi:hypothetical protein